MLDSGNCSVNHLQNKLQTMAGKLGMWLTQAIAQSTTQVGRSPWTARDAFVPLPEAESRSPRGREMLLDRTRLKQEHT